MGYPIICKLYYLTCITSFLPQNVHEYLLQIWYQMESESMPQHFESMKNRVWLLGDAIIDELYEYKNLGVLKNYVGSFSSNVEDNVDKTRRKVGLIFASNFDHRKVNFLVFMKLWKQACLPSLLFGVKFWMLTPTLLLKLERFQYWFLTDISTPSLHLVLLLPKLSALNSIESKVATKVAFVFRSIDYRA